MVHVPLRRPAHDLASTHELHRVRRKGVEKYSCDIFWKNRGPSTVSMTILVVVEMFNALNALSENESLLSQSPSSNPWLVGAIVINYYTWRFYTFPGSPPYSA